MNNDGTDAKRGGAEIPEGGERDGCVADEANFVFKLPPAAPVFRPTEEEFSDPLKYIAKIRSVAEEYGICKIITPSKWRPMFSLNGKEFEFTSCIQKLKGLNATTRVKISFEKTVKKINSILLGEINLTPVLDRKRLDLYSLYKIVESEGGFDAVCSLNKWNKVASRMGFMKKSSVSELKTHYKKLLYPFAVVQSIVNDTWKIENDKRFTKKITPKTYRSLICYDCNYTVHIQSQVKSCSTRPVVAVFKDKWRCKKCLIKIIELTKPKMYGFEHSPRLYNLDSFENVAYNVKTTLFHMAWSGCTPEIIEQEYWKNISFGDPTMKVLYGSDLNSENHGSGFPTAAKSDTNESNGYNDIFIKHGWNLNNISTLKDSVLSYFGSCTSRLNEPRMHVGMCFSTFCWHYEEHWSYSISYLHWGEPKTWYGVPGNAAENFEKVMKETVPELFNYQPDLLHQPVTMLNPNILMDANVPVYRIEQHKKEFVVTFPKAYHAGFNHGYNFAEAVNFTVADWISVGRECVGHYSSLRRMCVFSHDELMFKLIRSCDDLTPEMVKFVFLDLKKIVNFEKVHRRALSDWGVTDAAFVEFERCEDKLRKCVVCNTTVYVSGVCCLCNINKVACLQHFRQLCDICPAGRHVLKYRYTLKDFIPLLMKLKNRLELNN